MWSSRPPAEADVVQSNEAVTCLTDKAGHVCALHKYTLCCFLCKVTVAQRGVAVAPVQMVNSGHKHRVAWTLPRVLAGELQVLSARRVTRICHESALKLVRKAWQIDSTLSGSQCSRCQPAPVGIKVIALVVSVAQGEGPIQALLCCSVVRTPAGITQHGL